MKINFSDAEKVIYNSKEATSVYVGDTKVWDANDYVPTLGYTVFKITAKNGYPKPYGNYSILIKNSTTGKQSIKVIRKNNIEIDWCPAMFTESEVGDVFEIKGSFSLKSSYTIEILSSQPGPVIMSNMFAEYTGRTIYGLDKLDTSNAIDMSGMFYDSRFILEGNDYADLLDLSSFNTSKVTNMDSMFNKCFAKLSGLSNWDVSKVTSMVCMFQYAKGPTAQDVYDWNVSNVKNMHNMFFSSGVTSLDLSKWNVSNVTNISGIFSNCDILTSLDVSSWDVHNVTDMNCSFCNCKKLISLDVYNWNVSNVTDMGHMFYGCSSLTSLDLSSWYVSNVTDMGCMFYECHKLTSLDLSSWDVSNVTNMECIFYKCFKLTSLDLSSLDVSNVTNMEYMFYYCESLISLNLSNWDVSKVTSMSWMFENCLHLQSLDLSGWNTSSVENYGNMLYKVPSTCTIIINPTQFINKSTGTTFTPKELGWTGTFTDITEL